MTELQALDAPKVQALEQLKPIAKDCATFADTLEGIDVSTDDELATVADLVKFMNGKKRTLEDKRKSLVDPLGKVVRDINALFKPPRDLIEQTIANAKKKMNAYAQQQHILAEARAKAEREDAEREKREADDLAASLAEISTTAAPMAEEVVKQADKRVEKAAKPVQVAAVRSEQSTTAVNKTWTVEVLDVVALCRAVADGAIGPEMIDPNMTALRQFCRDEAVEREKFGCKFYQAISTTVR